MNLFLTGYRGVKSKMMSGTPIAVRLKSSGKGLSFKRRNYNWCAGISYLGNNVFSRKGGLGDRIRRASGLMASHFYLFVVEGIIWHFLLADWILWR